MRANTKKLLSALVVLAMVLSMVPVVGLPAIEANAVITGLAASDITTDANALQTGFANGVTTGTTCPACKQTNITWEPLTADVLGQTLSNNTQKHYYLSDNVNFDVATLFTMHTSNLCLHLNGKTMTTKGQIKANAGSVLTIMGQGTVQYTGTTSFIDSANYVFVYGGTYISTTGKLMNLTGGAWAKRFFGDSTFIGPVVASLDASNTVLCVYDRATFTDLRVEKQVKVQIYAGWSGTINKLSSDRDLTLSTTLTISGAITGKIFDAEGNRLIYSNSAAVVDPTYNKDAYNTIDGETWGFCEACGFTAKWTAMNAPLGTAVTNGGHYYVSDSYNDDGGDATYLMKSDASGWTGGTVCLHLNGKTIETSRRFYLGNTTTMNIMANGGGITYTGSNMLFEKNSNTLTISGGTWTGNKLLTSGSTFRAYLKDGATFNGLVTLTKGYLYLYDTASVTGLTVADADYTALRMEAGWTGSVTGASFAGMADGAIPNGTTGGAIPVDGANWAGSVTLAEGGSLKWDATRSCLVIDPDTVKAAKIGDTWYPSAQAAVDVATANDVVVLAANGTIDITGKTVTVDAAGHDVTVDGEGTLYAIDSANDTYDATKCGTWTISNVTKWEAEANGGKYVLIAEATAGTYTAHRLDIRISAVNLRTTQAGLYYTAEYKCDDVLLGKVESYGVALSLGEIPTDLVNSAFTSISTAFEANNDHTYSTYSGAVVNILTEGGEQNAANAIKAVKANAYLEINTGAAEPVVVMGIADSDDSADYSLASVLDKINAGWDTWMNNAINDAKGIVYNFYSDNRWNPVFVEVDESEDYDFSKIANYTV